MIIETKRLTVRTFREEDADALYRIKTDPQVTEFCPDFLDVCADRTDMQRYIFWMFVLTEQICKDISAPFSRLRTPAMPMRGDAMPLKARIPARW